MQLSNYKKSDTNYEYSQKFNFYFATISFNFDEYILTIFNNF